MQCLTHSISLGHNYVKRPCWLASFPGLLTYNAVASNALASCDRDRRLNFTSTSLAPRPMTVVFGLGTRLRVRMRTTLENGVLRNEQLSGSAMNFFDQGNFEAMKTLSGWEAAHCDKHQFRAKIKVSTRAVLELSLF